MDSVLGAYKRLFNKKILFQIAKFKLLSFRRYSGYNEVGGAGEGGVGRGTAEGGGGWEGD